MTHAPDHHPWLLGQAVPFQGRQRPQAAKAPDPGTAFLPFLCRMRSPTALHYQHSCQRKPRTLRSRPPNCSCGFVVPLFGLRYFPPPKFALLPTLLSTRTWAVPCCPAPALPMTENDCPQKHVERICIGCCFRNSKSSKPFPG